MKSAAASNDKRGGLERVKTQNKSNAAAYVFIESGFNKGRPWQGNKAINTVQSIQTH